MDLEVLILCGGFGTRLSSVVSDRPKCLAPINGVPFLDLIISNIQKSGIEKITLCTGFMSKKIEDKYRGRKNIFISKENRPLGTGGAIFNAMRFIKKNNILVMNGDSIMNIDYIDFFSKFIESKKKFAIGLQKKNDRIDVGGVLLTKDSMVEVFNSKYNLEVEFNYINCGVYMMRRELLESWMNGVYKISLEEQLIPCLIKSGIDIFGYSKIENLVDIGTPDRYENFKSFYAN